MLRRCPQDAPRGLQMASKSPPRSPQETPKRRKTSPNRTHHAKGRPPNDPKDHPTQLKNHFWGGGGAPRSAGSIRRPPGSPKDAGGVCGVPDPPPCFLRAYPPPYPPPTGHRDHRPPLWMPRPSWPWDRPFRPQRNAQIRKIELSRCLKDELRSLNK